MSRTCSNCFQPLPEGVEVCPVCGYDSRKTVGKYPLALPEGTVLNGQYILGRVLGQGGFGITYVAQDHRTGSLVAVKEYFPDTMATRSQGYTVSAYTGQREDNFTYGKECFLNEAKTLAEFIGNPNIVRVYSYFEENNTAYFVMEYVQGTSFQDYLKERGSIPWQEAKWILFPVMEALAAVHAKGIVHRDVTPDNIYITKTGEVKLLDFGAARYSLGDKSRSLDVVLKHGYAPKEQYSRHGRQGPFTDVYALGATFYFAITGRVPPDSIDRQDEDELILPSSLGIKIPIGVEDALCKALAVSAQDRFQSMGDFQLALRRGENEETPPPPQPPQPPVGGGSSGSQPPQPPVGGGSSGSQPPQPPAGRGDGDILSMLRALSPEKKKKLFMGVGALAAFFVVVFAVVLASGNPENGLEVKPSGETSQTSGVSQVTSSGTQGGAAETEVALLPEAEEETVRLETQYDNYDETGALIGTSQYVYDNWGNEIMRASYSPDGILEKYSQTFYDSQGNEVLIKNFQADGTLTSYSEHVFDGNTEKLYDCDVDEEPRLDWEKTFDEAGNELVFVNYRADGSVFDYRESEYGSDGVLKYKLEERYYEDGSLDTHHEFEYDSTGVLKYELKETYYEDGSVYLHQECEYDGSGQLIRKLSFAYAFPHSDKEEIDYEYFLQYEYVYDNAGNQVKELYYDIHDNLNGVYEREFDENGNLLVEYNYNGDGELSFVTENEYDSRGNLTFLSWSRANGEVLRIEKNEYDEHGELISSFLDYSPDDPGEDETLKTYENQYDTYGNLAYQVVFKNGVMRGASTYETRPISEPGGDPDLVPPTPAQTLSGSEPVSSQNQSSQPEGSTSTGAQSGEFTGSSHGLAGMKFAIVDIKSKKGFVDRYSGFPCGGLVDMEGGPWFLALYELETENSGYAVYYSLYDLRGNGLVVPACEELFVPVGGNNGKVGIYQDGDGTFYLMVEKREADGQTVYTSYSFTPITDDGLSLAGSSFASSEVNSEKGTGVYIVGDSKTDESGLEDFLGKYTPVCSMDLFGNYEGNVITFEDFVQNYT